MDIAIIGMSCRFSDAGDHKEFWKNLEKGLISVREIPPERWRTAEYYSPDISQPGKTASKWCGALDGYDRFDNPFFKIPDREAARMDPQQRLLLEEAWHCVEDSGLPLSELQVKRTCVFAGAMALDHLVLSGGRLFPVEAYSAAGGYSGILANRISHTLKLSGESYAIDAACASSSVVVHRARQVLLSHEADFVLAGAVSLNLHPFKYISFSKSRMLSPDGRCRPFDSRANGYVPGDGVAVLLLQRLDEALQDRNHIHGVIKGSAVNYARDKGMLTAPDIAAQTEVISSAMKNAGVSAQSITYVEAHGSGTPLGDPIEIEALKRAFESQTQARGFCRIGSVKANIGHTEAAAGMAGIIKVALMMKHRKIPANPNFERPNPVIDFPESPFRVPVELEDWSETSPLQAGVSSFGMGGVNGHLILEQAPETPPSGPLAPHPIPFMLSARTESALAALVKGWRRYVRSGSIRDTDMLDVSRTLAAGRQPFAHRFGALVRDAKELETALETAPKHFPETSPPKICLRINDISWQGKKDLLPLLSDPPAALDKSRYLLDRARRRVGQGMDEDEWPEEFKDLYRFTAGLTYLEQLLDAGGFRPDCIMPEGESGLWIALALSGMASREDAVLILAGEKEAKTVALSPPVTALLDPVTGKMIHPCQASPAYVASLIRGLSVSDEAVSACKEQFTALRTTFPAFDNLLQEWTAALEGMDVEKLLNTGQDRDRRLFCLIFASAVRQFHRKWRLPDPEVDGSPEFFELLDLVSGQAMPKSRLVRLIRTDSPDFMEAARILNQALEKQGGKGSYPLLKQVAPPHADQPEQWLRAAASAPAPPPPKDMILLDFGAPASRSENTAALIPGPGGIEATLFSLWMKGADIDFNTLYPKGGFNRVPLPVYPFEGKIFSIQASGEGAEERSGEETESTGAHSPHKMAQELRQSLMEIGADILMVRPSDMDPDSELAHNGFDSISMVDFSDRINERFKTELTPAIFFERPTISAVAEFMMETCETQVHSHFSPEKPGRRAPRRTVSPLETPPKEPPVPVAVIGMSGKFPLADTLDAFWRNLEAGRDCIREIPEDRDYFKVALEKAYDGDPPERLGWGGFIEGIQNFDPLFFGISPKEAQVMEPQQRLLMLYIHKAMENAGYSASSLSGSDAGIFIGMGPAGYGSNSWGPGDLPFPHSAAGAIPSLGPARMSWRLNIHGPSEPVETACSSSLVAIHKAMTALARGECRMAFAGGINTLLSPQTHIGFYRAGMLSKSGRCRTFSNRADGYVRGEGVGILLLKPLDKALADHDAIHGVLRSSAVNHGGRANFLTAPNGVAQADLIASVYRGLGIPPETIGYIEAHGTGTALGDPVEVNALKSGMARIFKDSGRQMPDASFCGLGSVKTNIGHLELAAGVAGVIKVLLQFKHKTLVKSLHCDTLNPHIDLDRSPFHLVEENIEWPVCIDANGQPIPRRAGISSFGLGGVNAHVLAEEFPAPHVHRGKGAGQRLPIPLSARTDDGLKRQARQLAEALSSPEGQTWDLRDIAYTLQTGRDAMDKRVIWTVGGVEELQDRLNDFCRGEDAPGSGIGGRNEADEMAASWARGERVDWNSLHSPDALPGRIPLPTYPFAEKAIPWPWEGEVAPAMEISGPPASPEVESKQGDAPFRDTPPLTDTGVTRGDGGEGNMQACWEAMYGIDMGGPDATDDALIGVSPNEIRSTPPGRQRESISPESHDGRARIEKLEKILSRTASGLLGVPEEEVPRDEEFRNLGFDSMTLASYAELLDKQFNITLDVAAFFDHFSISRLGKYLSRTFPDQILRHTDLQAPTTQDAQAVPTDRTAPTGRFRPSPEREAANINRIPADIRQSRRGPEPVAVIGMSGRFPMADDLNRFWQNLAAGKDCITALPPERKQLYPLSRALYERGGWDAVKEGGFIKDMGGFDPLFFEISPKEAELMDPQQRLTMMYIWKAMEDAGYASASLSGASTAIFVGAGETGYKELTHAAGAALESVSDLGLMPCTGPNRMSWFLNTHGPSEPIDAACASSLVAVLRAMDAISSGACDMAIAGGVNTIAAPSRHLSFTKAMMLSPTGRCRTFSHAADGYVRGEGVGMLALKRLSRAEADGDHIYGVLLSGAVNHGGRTHSLTAPSAEAQADLIASTYRRAAIDPDSVTYIETHGTGTKLGDPVEISGLVAAFDALYREAGKPMPHGDVCGLGALKVHIGHLELAAGVAGVIKVLLQIRYKTLIQTLHCDTVNPLIQLDASPFYINRKNREWTPLKGPDGSLLPRRAGVSAFGFTGVNAHLVLEEYLPAGPSQPSCGAARPMLIPLSAKTETALKRRASDLQAAIMAGELTEQDFAPMAFTLQTGRDAMEERLAVTASTMDELGKKLTDFIRNGKTGNGLVLGSKANNNDFLDMFRTESTLGRLVDEWIGAGKIAPLSELWVKGLPVDFQRFYQDGRPGRISLPSYAFDTEHYWFTAPSPEIAAPTRRDHPEQDAPDAGKAEQAPPEYQPDLPPRPHIRPTHNETADHDTTPAVALYQKAISFVRDILAEELKIPAKKIKDHTVFDAYGISSLMAKSIVIRFERLFGELPHVLLFRYRTLDELTDYLMSAHRNAFLKILDKGDEATSNACEESPPPRGNPGASTGDSPGKSPGQPIHAPARTRYIDGAEDFVDQLSDAQVTALLERLSSGQAPRPDRLPAGSAATRGASIVFMFPGIGEHHADMGERLYGADATFTGIVDHCCELTLPVLKKDLRDILFRSNGGRDSHPASKADPLRPRAPADNGRALLDRPSFVHPAVFMVEYALARSYMEKGLEPQAMIGLSVGEYAAACLSGVISLEDALAILLQRGRLVEELPKGGMVGTLLSEEEAQTYLVPGLSVGVVATPNSCMISGRAQDIEALSEKLATQRRAFKRLPVTHAFHSDHMRPVQGDFLEFLNGVSFHPPGIPYISNVTGTWIREDQAVDPGYWFSHLCRPVRFSDGVGRLLDDPDRIFVEVGPGGGLSSFVFQHPKAGRLTEDSIFRAMPGEDENLDRVAARIKTQAAGCTHD